MVRYVVESFRDGGFLAWGLSFGLVKGNLFPLLFRVCLFPDTLKPHSRQLKWKKQFVQLTMASLIDFSSTNWSYYTVCGTTWDFTRDCFPEMGEVLRGGG